MKLKNLVEKYYKNPKERKQQYNYFSWKRSIDKNDKVNVDDIFAAYNNVDDALTINGKRALRYEKEFNNCKTELELEKFKNNNGRRFQAKSSKKKKSNTPWIIGGLALLGIGAYAWSNRKTVAEKRTELITFARNAEVPSEEFVVVLNQMTDAEINSTYEYIFKYFVPNKTVPEGSKLLNEINVISAKYNIFT